MQFTGYGRTVEEARSNALAAAAEYQGLVGLGKLTGTGIAWAFAALVACIGLLFWTFWQGIRRPLGFIAIGVLVAFEQSLVDVVLRSTDSFTVKLASTLSGLALTFFVLCYARPICSFVERLEVKTLFAIYARSYALGRTAYAAHALISAVIAALVGTIVWNVIANVVSTALLPAPSQNEVYAAVFALGAAAIYLSIRVKKYPDLYGLDWLGRLSARPASSPAPVSTNG